MVQFCRLLRHRSHHLYRQIFGWKYHIIYGVVFAWVLCMVFGLVLGGGIKSGVNIWMYYEVMDNHHELNPVPPVNPDIN